MPLSPPKKREEEEEERVGSIADIMFCYGDVVTGYCAGTRRVEFVVMVCLFLVLARF